MANKLRRLFPLFLFLIAFVPRAVQPVSRPLVWYLHSARFINTILAGDWENTVYAEHPGISIVWPAGIGLKLYWLASGASPTVDSVPDDVYAIHFFGPVPVAEIAAAVLPLALLVALGIVFAWYLLRRLCDETTAAIAGVMLALCPLYLAESKILHTEALLATLILLGGLVAITYARERRRRWLVVGGLLTGYAFLTKSASVFILPYNVLVWGLYALPVTYHELKTGGPLAAIAHLMRRVIVPLSVWLLIAILTFVALWPVMWVNPQKGIDVIRWGISHHTSTPHDTPNFFRGQVTYQDPGMYLYVLFMLFKTTTIELAFLSVAGLLGLVYLFRERTNLIRRRALSPNFVLAALLMALALFFTLQMGLAAKKIGRYMVPSILALDVIAALSIVKWAQGLAQLSPVGQRRRVYLIALAVPLMLQAALVLPRHPYYSVICNWAAGGPPEAARNILTGTEGAGLAKVASYLNQRDDAAQLTVAAQLKHVFSQYFQGRTVDIDQPADYVLFHRNYIARDYKIKQWASVWERYSPRKPELQIDFDGVPFAWLYPTENGSLTPDHPLKISLGKHGIIHLDGYDLDADALTPGKRFSFVLYWRAGQALDADLSVFVHLLDPQGKLVAQDDSGPAHGARPTYTWTPDESIVDPHQLLLPAQSPPGNYRLRVGLYDWRTSERLSIMDEPDDHVELAELSVAQPDTPAWVWVARTLFGLFALTALLPFVGSAIKRWRPPFLLHRRESV